MARVFGLLLGAMGVMGIGAGMGCRAERPGGAADTTGAAVDSSAQRTAAVEAMTDGGAVLMPEARRQALIGEDALWAEALRIHYHALVVDGHLDTPTLMLDDGYRFADRHPAAASHVDLPRLFEGGLDAAFFSIYVAHFYGEGEGATRRALDMIAELKRQVAARPDTVAMAYSAADVRRLARAGRKAVLMGLEGGHALAGSADVLRRLYDEGIRYVGLTHVNTNAWADASQTPPRWGGLNDLGRDLVRAMNDLGVVVDLSHASDSTFYDALAVTRAPVLLSHSSARALAGGVRNVDDAMLRAVAANGGVVMINFFDPVVNPHLTPDVYEEAYRRLGGREADLRQLWNVVYAIKQERGLPGATLGDVVDHIDHVARVAGVDHVGLGSDFDGVFDLPDGLEDVTRLPWITYELLRRGYAEEDVYKILGGNALRVLEAAETARGGGRE